MSFTQRLIPKKPVRGTALVLALVVVAGPATAAEARPPAASKAERLLNARYNGRAVGGVPIASSVARCRRTSSARRGAVTRCSVKLLMADGTVCSDSTLLVSYHGVRSKRLRVRDERFRFTERKLPPGAPPSNAPAGAPSPGDFVPPPPPLAAAADARKGAGASRKATAAGHGNYYFAGCIQPFFGGDAWWTACKWIYLEPGFGEAGYYGASFFWDGYQWNFYEGRFVSF